MRRSNIPPLLALIFSFIMLIVVMLNSHPVQAQQNQYTYNITATTNGYPTYTLVKLNASDVNELRNSSNGLIAYEIVNNNLIFLAENDETYTVYTNNPVTLDEYQTERNATLWITGNYNGNGTHFIRGAGIASTTETVIISANNSVIENFVWDDQGHSDGAGVICIYGHNNTIRDITILNAHRYGFTLRGGTNNTITNCEAIGVQYAFSGSGSMSDNNTIQDSTCIHLSRNAVKVKGMSNTIIQNNYFQVEPVGWADDGTVTGIALSRDLGSQNITVRDNTIIRRQWNFTELSMGIKVGENPPLEGSNFTNLEVYNNTFVNMRWGFYCDNPSSYCTALDNIFINCTTDVTDTGSNTFTNNTSHDKQYYQPIPNDAGVKGDLVTVFHETGLGGEGKHYGLFPAAKTRVTVDVSWTNTNGVYVYIMGFKFTCYTYAGQVRIFGETDSETMIDCLDNDNATRCQFYIDVSAYDGSCTFYWPGDEDEGAKGLPLNWYYGKYQEHTANSFTPTMVYTADIGTSVSSLNMLRQQIYVHGLCTAVGSRRHQAIGFDGPATWAECGDGLNDLISNGYNFTMFFDWTKDTNSSFTDWINNTGCEMGIYYQPSTLNSLINSEFEGNVTTQHNYLNANFTKNLNTSYTVSGTGWLTNTSRVSWMVISRDQVQRANRVPVQVPNSGQLNDGTFSHLDNATTLGYAVEPLYTHETEITPADAGSIDSALWDLWITHLGTGYGQNVTVCGYYEWYMINSNIESNHLDASFNYLQYTPPTPPTAGGTTPLTNQEELIAAMNTYFAVFGLGIMALAGGVLVFMVHTGTATADNLLAVVGSAVGLMLVMIIWGVIQMTA